MTSTLFIYAPATLWFIATVTYFIYASRDQRLPAFIGILISPIAILPVVIVLVSLGWIGVRKIKKKI